MPKFRHGRVETVFEVDERAIRPKVLPDLFAADNFTRPLQQKNQDPERLILYLDPHAVLPELPSCPV